jgi:hypothetical protein
VLEPAVSPTHAAERFKRWLLGERIEPSKYWRLGSPRGASAQVQTDQGCQLTAVKARRTKTPEPCRAPAQLVQKSGRDGGGKSRPD